MRVCGTSVQAEFEKMDEAAKKKKKSDTSDKSPLVVKHSKYGDVAYKKDIKIGTRCCWRIVSCVHGVLSQRLVTGISARSLHKSRRKIPSGE